MASFPASVKSFTQIVDGDVTSQTHMNVAYDEIEALEGVLFGSTTQETLKISSTGKDVLKLHRNSNTEDHTIDLLFQGNDSDGTAVTYGKIVTTIEDNTAGAFRGELYLSAPSVADGTLRHILLGTFPDSYATVMNPDGIDIDTRMESVDNTFMFFLAAASESITIGSGTQLATFGIDGQVDKKQLVVQGHSTQNQDIFEVQKSDGTQCFAVGADKIGFYATAPIALQTGVAATEAGIFAALVALGLITA